MKPIFTILFFLTSLIGFSQDIKGNALIPDSLRPIQIERTDSFVFASKTYAIPRDCEGQDQSNCCSYASRPDQLGCNNGTGLSWDYMPTMALATMNMEEHVKGMQQQQKSVKIKKVKCFLVDKEVDGYLLHCETKDNYKWNIIIVAGEVEGKPMLVSLRSSLELNQNRDIQPVIHQILRYK